MTDIQTETEPLRQSGISAASERARSSDHPDCSSRNHTNMAEGVPSPSFSDCSSQNHTNMTAEELPDLLCMTQGELADFLAVLGEKSFRAKQVYDWLHVKGVRSFDGMTNLSKALRDKLRSDAFEEESKRAEETYKVTVNEKAIRVDDYQR